MKNKKTSLEDDLEKSQQKVNELLPDRIKFIAKNYHNRIVVASSHCIFGGENKFKCGCCFKTDCSDIHSIEHDSKNNLKDISVCTDCFKKIYIFWQNNKLEKSLELININK